MTRVLHTARISNVEIIKCVVNNKDGNFFLTLLSLSHARVIVEKDHLHYLSPSLKFTIFIIYFHRLVFKLLVSNGKNF